MAVTYNKPVQIDVTTWRVSGTTDRVLPRLLRYYQNGIKIGSVISTSGYWERDIHVPPGETVQFEVLDHDNAIPSPAFSGRTLINWLAATDATRYRIEQNIAAVWTELATLAAGAQTAFRWPTGYLDDQTTHQFRIIPIKDDGNEGMALTESFLMVRSPDTPEVAFSYSAGTNKVTISAVA